MSASHIPAGYHSLTPAIIVRDAARAIEFYKRAFGAELIERMDGPDGKVMHAEIRVGDSVLMLGEENEEWGMRSPLSLGGSPSSLHMYVPDADAAVAKAIAAGAKERYPMEDAFWGDRYGKVTDPYGHEWGIATRVKNLSPAEMKQAAEAWMKEAARKAQTANA
jgi:uncharacterized glyoxalase superfamily protein PhnB